MIDNPRAVGMDKKFAEGYAPETAKQHPEIGHSQRHTGQHVESRTEEDNIGRLFKDAQERATNEAGQNAYRIPHVHETDEALRMSLPEFGHAERHKIAHGRKNKQAGSLGKEQTRDTLLAQDFPVDPGIVHGMVPAARVGNVVDQNQREKEEYTDPGQGKAPAEKLSAPATQDTARERTYERTGHVAGQGPVEVHMPEHTRDGHHDGRDKHRNKQSLKTADSDQNEKIGSEVDTRSADAHKKR